MIVAKLHSIYLALYRSVGFLFLVTLIGAVFFYFGVMIFFTVNKSWALPVVLSPSQDKVLQYQSQAANFKYTLEKQKIELQEAEITLTEKTKSLEQLRTLKSRLNKTINTEANRSQQNSRAVIAIVPEMKTLISRGEKLREKLSALNATTDSELKAGLITKDEATLRRKEELTFSSDLVQKKATINALTQESQELNSVANTLRGGTDSLASSQVYTSLADLDLKIAQLSIDLQTLEASISSLRVAVSEAERVLGVMEDSPHFLALTKPVNIAFVPYENINDLKENTPVYVCYLKFLFCHKAGKIEKVYDRSEEYARHPVFATELKGRFLRINFRSKEDEQSEVIFIGRRPLFV